MSRARAALLLVGVIAVVGFGIGAILRPPTILVRAGEPVITDGVPPGATVVLGPGRHPGFEVDRRVTVRGSPGAEVVGEILVRADGARLLDVTVTAGENGITVEDADRVLLERVGVTGTDVHGIEIVGSTATVRDCRIDGPRGPYGQAIEIRNSMYRGINLVEGCRISDANEGLVAHVSRVIFRDNTVVGTSFRGIKITEMSEGIASRNVVTDATGVAYYCGDMSHCEFRDNRARAVGDDGSGNPTQAGIGVVATMHSVMRLTGNALDVEGVPVASFIGSRVTEESPLSGWPPGWRGALAGIMVGALSIGGLLLVRSALLPIETRLGRRWGRRRDAGRRDAGRRWGRRRGGAPSRAVLGILLWGLAVQTFHMLEHVVQVFQVYVADSAQRQGVLGARVDTEWVHFAYNAVVLAFLLWALVVFVPSHPRARGFLLAATLIQTYHLVEHVAKVVQHVATAVDPAPGLLGARAGLVWFHFGINLAVYVGLAIAATRVGREHTRRTIATTPALRPSPA